MGHSARSTACALTIALLAPGVMGMGGFGGGEKGLPAREFRATLTDVDGTRIDLTGVTSAGDASVEGDLGRGRLRVPFDNISRISFQPVENERDRVRAQIQLREGEPISLTLRSSTTFAGRTPGGVYQVRARDLKAVEFGR